MIPLPQVEHRLQMRYQMLVTQHLHTSEKQAPGSRSLPNVNEAFAATQGAWRFYSNPNVSLQKLAQPLIEQARKEIAISSQQYGLVIHDWSNLVYSHAGKRDRKEIGSEQGYELSTALLISDLTGEPIAPISLALWASDGWHRTLNDEVPSELSPLDLVSETMEALNQENLPIPLVHIIDREGDSIYHYRQWQANNHLFLIRAKTSRKVIWEGQDQLLINVAEQLPLIASSAVEVATGVIGQLFVGETSIVINRSSCQRSRTGKRKYVKGEPLELRLIVCQLRLPDESIAAQWYLLSNVPHTVHNHQLAEWYYWRWKIESYFKLLKSQGFQVDQWQQETVEAIAKRLLVVAMACILVWQIQRATDPHLIALRDLLIRLSGRQVRRGHHTAPAILAGLWVFLSAIELLEHYDLNDLKQMARHFMPGHS